MAFVVCAWVIPETNQAFRESLFNPPRFLARGANELTFPELTARLAALKSTSGVEARAYVLSFHTRLAASVAPVVWGIFALSLASVTRRTLLSTTIFVLAAIIYIAFATFVIGGTDTFFWLPIAYVIWLPNLLFALMTFALWIAARTPSGGAAERRAEARRLHL
jgi:lipopolysaccharide export LptBFGC system permease protein LptF